eukprot:g22879.t1
MNSMKSIPKTTINVSVSQHPPYPNILVSLSSSLTAFQHPAATCSQLQSAGLSPLFQRVLHFSFILIPVSWLTLLFPLSPTNPFSSHLFIYFTHASNTLTPLSPTNPFSSHLFIYFTHASNTLTPGKKEMRRNSLTATTHESHPKSKPTTDIEILVLYLRTKQDKVMGLSGATIISKLRSRILLRHSNEI